MQNTPSTLKRFLPAFLPLIFAFAMAIPQAHAARYFLGDNDTLVKGCSGTIEIKVDTVGANAMAGDSMITLKPAELTVNQVSIGNMFPMQVFNQFTGTEIKLSGARLPMSGAYKGVGTFGYISFTSALGANSGTFAFSQDFTGDNTLVDENIDNVLTEALGKTYTFMDRYNKNINGVGFCTPDTTGPTFHFITPAPSSSNNPIVSNVIFSLTDDRSGVDIGTLTFSIDGVPYTPQSAQVTVDPDGAAFRVETNPNLDFKEGSSVSVSARACDKNVPANCTTTNTSFRIFSPAPAPSVCGDGFLNPNGGEQCDDSNRVSGDGCSPFCLFETSSLPSSCFDGLQNQGESGLDCGGPCSRVCPSCVDGVLNQGEIGVDCGGPCPVCGSQPKAVCEIPNSQTTLETLTICYTPDNDPTSPYTMIIPKSFWPDYEKRGDSQGACSKEAMCQILMPVAPEIEKKATEDAKIAFDTQSSVLEQKVVIEAPKTQAVVIDQIVICKAIPDYLKANFDSASSDTDGDGLSDRTECYAKTSPINPDTDTDGCSDGDELNRFSSNPLDGTDCTMTGDAETGFNQVLVTDPKPSWTLGNLTPRFSGIAPLRSTAITVTVFHADQKIVKELSAATNGVLQANDSTSVPKAVSTLRTSIQNARTFVNLNGADFNYVDLQAMVTTLETQIQILAKDYANPSLFVPKDYFDMLKQLGFGDLGLDLGALLREPIVIGSTNDFSATIIATLPASSFELLPGAPLEDMKLYDVVATATLGDRNISSAPIQFGVNTGFTVSIPVPRTLGGKLIPVGGISFNGILIPTAFAQGDSGKTQIEIDQIRPVITGDSEFGSQVFAIWNSVVLSSSVIADSEAGSFEIQAPRDLEPKISHRVTLYAVKTDKDKILRSESVDINFRIKTEKTSLWMIFFFIFFFLILLIAAYLLSRRLKDNRSVVPILQTSEKKNREHPSSEKKN